MIQIAVWAFRLCTFIVLPACAVGYLASQIFGVTPQTGLALALCGFVAARLARNGFR